MEVSTEVLLSCYCGWIMGDDFDFSEIVNVFSYLENTNLTDVENGMIDKWEEFFDMKFLLYPFFEKNVVPEEIDLIVKKAKRVLGDSVVL